VGRYKKGKTYLDFTEARDSEWQWNSLGHMQVCTSLQTDNHTNTTPLSFFTGWMPFLPPNQQCQSTEGNTGQQTYEDNPSMVLQARFSTVRVSEHLCVWRQLRTTDIQNMFWITSKIS